MWTCIELKRNAWKNLSQNYWWSLLLVFLYTIIVSIFSSVVSGLISVLSPVLSIIYASSNLFVNSPSSFSEILHVFSPIIIVVLIISAISALFSYAVIFFISNPLLCGVYKWFAVLHEQKAMHSIEELFAAFRKQSYKFFVSAMAWKVFWSSLWSILSIIPILIPVAFSFIAAIKGDQLVFQMSKDIGISSSSLWAYIVIIIVILYLAAAAVCVMINLNRRYAYLFVPLILADNPEIGFRKALRQSIQMTKGQKSKMFILDLSFIGWWLLVLLTCGFLSTALLPYIYATYTELYFFRKEEIVYTKKPHIPDPSDNIMTGPSDDTLKEN